MVKLVQSLFPVANTTDQNNSGNTSETQPAMVNVSSLGLTKLSKEDVDELILIYDELGDTDLHSENLEKTTILNKLRRTLETLKEGLVEKSRTAKLWILYMSYVATIKLFIRAERTGNWDGHLAATQKMLNLYGRLGIPIMRKVPGYIFR